VRWTEIHKIVMENGLPPLYLAQALSSPFPLSPRPKPFGERRQKGGAVRGDEGWGKGICFCPRQWSLSNTGAFSRTGEAIKILMMVRLKAHRPEGQGG